MSDLSIENITKTVLTLYSKCVPIAAIYPLSFIGLFCYISCIKQEILKAKLRIFWPYI